MDLPGFLMTLIQILVFICIGLIIGKWSGFRWRTWLMLGSSVLAIFWLQPGMPVRNLDFWFPVATLALVIFVWAVTRRDSLREVSRQDLLSALLIFTLVILIGLSRYFEPLCCLTATRPPPIMQIVMAATLTAGAVVVLIWLGRKQIWLSNLFVIGIILLFIILKTEPLAAQLSVYLRSVMQQNVMLASALDIRWLGFSYVSFRLIHILRDRVAGRLPDVSLGEMVTFVIFFPAFTAGPIDRVQRFTPELRNNYQSSATDILQSGERIVWGILKKFVIADSLALFALNTQNAVQINSTIWMWIVLYAYTLLIFFDFSGYTDIAIGLGTLMGTRLPENFNRPYLQKNLTQFWNSWHMTLAQWFRAYYFNPVTRALRSKKQIPVQLIILFGQLSTMILIGLWHGITWNFAIWGAWHGIGLFAHNRWSEYMRARSSTAEISQRRARLIEISGILLTFNFVAIGWVWFSLPSPELSTRVIGILFGVGP